MQRGRPGGGEGAEPVDGPVLVEDGEPGGGGAGGAEGELGDLGGGQDAVLVQHAQQPPVAGGEAGGERGGQLRAAGQPPAGAGAAGQGGQEGTGGSPSSKGGSGGRRSRGSGPAARAEGWCRDVRLSDEALEQIINRYGPREAAELILLASYYNMVSRFLESTRVEVEDEQLLRGQTPGAIARGAEGDR